MKPKMKNQIKKNKGHELIATLNNSKDKFWKGLVEVLSRPKRKRISMNLERIGREAKDGETVLIPGKVLSHGEIKKKIKIIAKGFSGKTEEKLLKSKIKFLKINEEIKNNPGAKGIRILK